MASTITIKSDAYKGRYMQLVCEQTKDEANNKSVIKWTLSSIGGEVNYYSTGPTSVFINATCVYYKDRVNYTAEAFPAKTGSVSGETIIDHNEDGTKGTSVLLNTVVYYGSGSVKGYSKWWELDPIQSYAKIQTVPPTFSIGNLPTITYTNPLEDKAYKVQICIADSTGVTPIVPYRDVSMEKESSYTFKEEDVKILNEYVPKNSQTLGVQFVIYTKTADGKDYSVGEPSTYEMLETTDTEPKVTSTTLSVINPPTVPASLANSYIQGKSRVKATITAKGEYGASITSYSLNVGGVTNTSSANEIASDAITSFGNVSVIVSANDSRGFTGWASTTIEDVLEYSKPSVEPYGSESTIRCYRCDDEKNPKGASTKVCIKAKMLYHSLGDKNGCTLQWRRRTATQAWNDTHKWTPLATTGDGYWGIVGDDFALNASYSIQIKAEDDLGEYDVEEFEIPTQDVALHLGAGGKRVTVGDYCEGEDYTFRSAWKAIFDKGMIDGTDTGWLTLNSTTSYCRTHGHVTVVAWCGGQVPLSADAYTNVGTLPEGFRPAIQIPLVYHTQGGSIVAKSGYIDSDGNIELFSKETNVYYWAFSVTYPI